MATEEQETTRTSRSPGRPRSGDIDTSVRGVALALAYEGGIGAATVERIAQQSGVAKTTIYRRWHSASAVVMDAFMTDIAPSIPYVEKAGVALTFQHAVNQFIKAIEGQRGRLLRQLVAAAQLDDELRKELLAKWIAPRRADAAAVIARARARGEFKGDVDTDVLIDIVFGAVYYRLLMPYAALDRKFSARLMQQVFSGLLAGAPPLKTTKS